MRICCTSDLHGFLPALNPCDLLLIGGDICPVNDHSPRRQKQWIEEEFTDWIESAPAGQIVWIAGNHDFVLDFPHPNVRLAKGYARDELVEAGGLRIWCSPWSPRFQDWAFMDDEAGLARRYAAIPAGVDIILSHTPPREAGDRLVSGIIAGSESLRRRIVELSPALVVCGHIHEGYGEYRAGNSRVLNVSYLDENYRPAHPPVYFDWEERSA